MAAQKSVQNLTTKRLYILGAEGHSMVLAPLEQTEPLSEDTTKHFDWSKARQSNKVRVDERTEANAEKGLAAIFYVGFISAIFLAAFAKSISARYLVVYWVGSATAVLIVMLLIALGTFGGIEQFFRAVGQLGSFLAILAIGAGLPAAVIYFFGGGEHVLSQEGPMGLEVLGRSLQLLFIAVASLLPALLFYLFDRQQSATLRRRVEQQIFRFDPTVQNLIELRAKYGRQIEEVFGVESTSGSGRILRGTRLPILVATLVITLGWVVTLLPVRSGPAAGDVGRDNLLEFLAPERSPLVFGFLGAYLFSLTTILRRYARGDLKPKAYSSIAVRMFVVAVIAWAVTMTGMWQNAAVGIAFFAGILPEFVLTLLRERAFRHGVTGRSAPALEDAHPLTNLEGIDIYDRARLADEGVTNIEALAHHDLIDLIIETRLPAPRIVDWLDQAILYLHVSGAGAADGSPGGTVGLRGRLREFGIRTATDLEQAYAGAQKRESGNAFLAALGEDTDPAKPVRLQVILDAMDDDEWLDSIRHWRQRRPVEEEHLDAVPAPVAEAVKTDQNPAPDPTPGIGVATAAAA